VVVVVLALILLVVLCGCGTSLSLGHGPVWLLSGAVHATSTDRRAPTWRMSVFSVFAWLPPKT